MFINVFTALAPALFAIVAILEGPVNPGDIEGTWYTKHNEAIVQVFEREGSYYGRILSLSRPLDKEGNPKKDRRNKDQKLRERALVGMHVLYDLKFNASGQWEGKVYIPSVGREANAIITLKNKNTLQIRGFLGNENIGKTQLWTRIE